MGNEMSHTVRVIVDLQAPGKLTARHLEVYDKTDASKVFEDSLGPGTRYVGLVLRRHRDYLVKLVDEQDGQRGAPSINYVRIGAGPFQSAKPRLHSWATVDDVDSEDEESTSTGSSRSTEQSESTSKIT